VYIFCSRSLSLDLHSVSVVFAMTVLLALFEHWN